MKRRIPHSLCAAFLLSTGLAQATLVVTDSTWKGNGGNSYTDTPNNWVGNVAPNLTDGSTSWENLIFPGTGANFVILANTVHVYGLSVTGHYHFNGNERTINLYAGGLTYSVTQATHLQFEGYADINLAENQTWNIGSNGIVQFTENSGLKGTGQLTKTGAGTLDTSSASNNWSGGLQFNEGTIVLRPGDYGSNDEESRSLGTGLVQVGPDTTHRPTFVATSSNDGYGGDAVNLANNFELNGVFSSKNETELNLLGTIQLNAATTFRTAGENTFIHGTISGAHKLTVNSSSGLILFGSSNWTGGTEVTKGVLIFAGDGNTPGSPGGISVGTDGYVGIGVDHSVPAFVSQISTASDGTIGFDSDVEESVDTFTGTIDLSSHANLRLGSATAAKLDSAATIAPHGTTYRFGGGGGWLQVAPVLTSGNTVTVNSPSDLPLTVRFTNTTNAFTGITVTHSGAVFAAGALPVSATLSVAAGAYLGTENPADSATPQAINEYIARFGATSGIIGFDTDPFAEIAVTREVNLTGQEILGGLTSAYLGTASALMSGDEVIGPGVRFTGSIAPNSDGTHRFAAYKGGALEISGTLGGTGLIIGHPDSLGAFGDRTRGQFSTVLISGNNSGKLANGTTLYGGQLLVGQAAGDGVVGSDHTHALGEGTLTIGASTFTIEESEGFITPAPLLSVAAADIIIENPIQLNAPELSTGGEHNFTLAGVISGSGELYVGDESEGNFTLTLSAANTFTGGVYVANGSTLIAGSNTALGTGPLSFGNTSESNEGEIVFTTAAPVIGTLDSDTQGNLSFSHAAPILTINQSSDGSFRGEFRSENMSDALRVVKSGTGTLFLEEGGLYVHSGIIDSEGAPQVSLQVNQGTLVIGNDFVIEDRDPTIRINGGTLVIDSDVEIDNPVTVASGARLAGHGFVENVSIGNGAILSPGSSATGAIGSLDFEHLELDSGGIYEWQIRNPDMTGDGRDLVNVGTDSIPLTLVINATSANPSAKFTLKVISLSLAGAAGGQLNGIDVNHGLYTWTLIDYDLLSVPGNENTFDPAAFILDVSQFTTAQGTGGNAGTFAIFQQGNQILLGFTPVPEPSTYALMALGLGFIGLTMWRKSHRNS